MLSEAVHDFFELTQPPYDDELTPALLGAGNDTDEKFVLTYDGDGRLTAVHDLSQFFARQRRQAAEFPSARVTSCWFKGRVDLASNQLIEPDDEELVQLAMELWSIGQEFQLPLLRSILPGIQSVQRG